MKNKLTTFGAYDESKTFHVHVSTYSENFAGVVGRSRDANEIVGSADVLHHAIEACADEIARGARFVFVTIILHDGTPGVVYRYDRKH